jgi:peptidoglycan-associated lipoprotein
MKINPFLVLFIFVLNTLSIYAQKDYSKDADRAFASEEYYTAIDLYKKAYSKEKVKDKKAEIVFRIAECYRKINNTKQAETWYKKADKINYPDPTVIFYLAETKKMQGKYEEALIEYNRYLEKKPGDKKAVNGAKSCEESKKWIDKPTRYKVDNVALLNTKQDDFCPTYAKKDYKELIFTSSREGTTGSAVDGRTGENFRDLFITQLDKKGKWSTPVPLGETINSKDSEGAACLNRKYNTIYFTRCLNENKKVTGCQIYTAKSKGQDWAESAIFPVVPDTITVGHPSMSDDENDFYFTSDMPGGYGGKDIWVVHYDKKAKTWSAPENLGSVINTEADEMFPYIHSDGSFYFSSNGHVGMGGMDVFKAEKTGDKWDKITNMRYPINSSSDDFGITFEDKAEKGYLTSNRDGGKGGDDIYSFVLPPIVFTVQGVVTDKKTLKAITSATVSLVGTDGSSLSVTTDKTGSYKFDLKPNTSYVITASSEKYLKNQAKETTVGIEEDRNFVHDLALDPIDIPIELPNIFYDLAKWTLRPESEEALNKLIETLNLNPTIVIELSSNTDYRGSDKYNEDLSQKRAQSVVDYLIAHEIDPERLVAKGYGEGNPKVIDSKKDEDVFGFKVGVKLDPKFIDALPTDEEKEKAHQMNRRTEMKVLRKDFVPKAKSNTEGSGNVAPTEGSNNQPVNTRN